MLKTDITKNNLYIEKILNVIASEISDRPKPWNVKNRHSDAFVYVLKGECIYSFDDGYSFTAKRGNIVYLANNSCYKMELITQNYGFIFCDFTFGGETVRKSDLYLVPEASGCEDTFRAVFKKFSSSSKNSYHECMQLIYKIYKYIYDASENNYTTKSIKAKIHNSKDYIDRNFRDASLSVSLVAQMASMSGVHFRNLFKSIYKTGPAKYIMSVRIKNAKELMKYPFLNLEECALQSGFSSLQYFCRAFKKYTGMTPAVYRKENIEF